MFSLALVIGTGSMFSRLQQKSLKVSYFFFFSTFVESNWQFKKSLVENLNISSLHKLLQLLHDALLSLLTASGVPKMDR